MNSPHAKAMPTPIRLLLIGIAIGSLTMTALSVLAEPIVPAPTATAVAELEAES